MLFHNSIRANITEILRFGLTSDPFYPMYLSEFLFRWTGVKWTG